MTVPSQEKFQYTLNDGPFTFVAPDESVLKHFQEKFPIWVKQHKQWARRTPNASPNMIPLPFPLTSSEWSMMYLRFKVT